jgi:hypothetical protein
MGVNLLEGLLCVGNVCGVRGWVVMGVNLLKGVYCV